VPGGQLRGRAGALSGIRARQSPAPVVEIDCLHGRIQDTQWRARRARITSRDGEISWNGYKAR
jgi:hypothetical protein